MARKKRSTRSAKVGQRRAARQREQQLRKIEKLLGEDFSSLAEAKRALAEETSILPPSKVDVDDADEYDARYDQWDDADFDFDDRGEFEAGVET